MARADKTKVIKRSDKVSPITQNEMDENLQQIRNVIDDVTDLETNQSDFLRKDDSLSEIGDPSVGRAALDVYSKAESDNRYVQKANIGTISNRDLYISEDEPQSTDGNDGDVWFIYTASSGGSGETEFEIQLTASDAEPDDLFGSSVAVDGTRLVVGAPFESTADFFAGKVYIYEWNGTTSTYDEVGTLTASDAEKMDRFGYSVALDGTRLVVGTPDKDLIGKVYIYDWNGTTYVEVGTLTASDAKSGDLFGYSVTLDDTRLIVSTPDRDLTGKVYIYDWNGTTYDEVATLTKSDAQQGDQFGSYVALDGTRLVVGAPHEDTTTTENAGRVYIYEWNGTNYDEVATLTASDAEIGDIFGYSVALAGTRLVVGAPNKDMTGKVYIYEWNGTNYNEVATLTASDAEVDDYFGDSVALDGTRLVVGAESESTAADSAGKVYIYSDIQTIIG